MSAGDCIRGKAEAGKVDRDRAEEAAALYDELAARHGERMGSADAAARAGLDAAAAMETRLTREQANRFRMARRGVEIQKAMDAYGGNPAWVGVALLARTNDPALRLSNVEGRTNAVLGTAHAIAERALRELRPRGAGLVRNKARVQNVVRALFGEQVGDPAAQAAAKAWADAAEYLRQRFNAAGGAIARRADWGLPQRHDMRLVRKATKDEWIGFIRPLLDRAKMLDNDTGQPLGDARLEELLGRTYDRIRTDGMIDSEPGFAPRGGAAIANSRMESRFLAFRDADAWLAYQQRFGAADLHGILFGHLADMATDIARMEILGPNPRAMLTYVEQAARKRVKTAGEGEDVARAALREMRAIDDEQTGRAGVPTHTRIARGMQSLRNVLTSAQLGAAFLSAFSDLNFQQMARGMNGLPAVTRGMGPLLRLFAPGSMEDKAFAVQMGLVAENWSSMAIAQGRYFGETVGPEWSRLFADVVLRASLLSPWTQAGRWAFGLEFLGHLGRQVGKGLDAMDPATARALARYGIDEAAWARLTAEAVTDHRGAPFLDLRRAYEIDPELGNRLHEMVLTETDRAVPSATDRTRAQVKLNLGAGAPPGSFAGEVLRSVAMYKSFPVTLVHIGLVQGLREAMPRGQRARYFAQLVIGTTLFGALSIQAKHLSRGRDPEDMTTPQFWGAAAIQGGGLGIFGDFLFSDVNRFGGSLAQTAAGPVVAFGDDVRRLTFGNAIQAATGEDTKLGRELVDFLKRYTPGSSLWWARLSLERMVWDQLALMADPEAPARFRREEQRAMRERGQRYFWRPGRTAPDRAPDLSPALGG